MKMSVFVVLWLPPTPVPTFKKMRQREECRTKSAAENPERCTGLGGVAREMSRKTWNL